MQNCEQLGGKTCAPSRSLRSETRRVCAEDSLLGEVVEPRIDLQTGPSLQAGRSLRSVSSLKVRGRVPEPISLIESSERLHNAMCLYPQVC